MRLRSDLGCKSNDELEPAVTSWKNSWDFTSEDAHKLATPTSSSEAGQSSAVYDGGDSAQLKQRQYPIVSPTDEDTEQLLSGAGDGHESLDSSFLLGNGDMSTTTTLQPSQRSFHASDNDLIEDTLENQILASLQASSGKKRKRFLPMDKLDQVITLERVRKQLQMLYEDKPYNEVMQLAHDICDEVKATDSSLTTRRKIFATLLRIQKATCITYFIEEGLYDCHLPFYFPEPHHQRTLVYRKQRRGADIPIECFSTMNWTPFECENFQQYQWEFQAPYFEIISDGRRKRPLHYALDDRAILPFIEDSEEDGTGGPSLTSGGYSDVWRIRIHPAHHTHPSKINPVFAVKRLKPNNRNQEMFRREVSTLKRLSGQNHVHLIKLQVTYLYRDRYHLLFRWADGNLRDYWENHPNPSDLPRTQTYAVWVASQWLGLAQGLLAIHNCPADEIIDPEDEQLCDGLDSQRVNGRHGDIKPENILWFDSYESQDSQYPKNGRLVISDFGLTEFHRDETGLVSPRDVARSPTYRAPEYDVSANISQDYDIWTLGCVLLEFIVWYLHGFEAFDQFSKDRANEDTRPIKEDVYFTITEKFQTGDGKVFSAAVFKQTVAGQIDALREDANVTKIILDALDIIEENMLRMNPEKRASCDEVVAKFDMIFTKASENPNYCVQPVPGKSKPKRTATDLSVLSPYLVFDPITRLPVPDNEVVPVATRKANPPRKLLSKAINPSVPQTLDNVSEESERNLGHGLNWKGHGKQERGRIHKLFRGCFR